MSDVFEKWIREGLLTKSKEVLVDGIMEMAKEREKVKEDIRNDPVYVAMKQSYRITLDELQRAQAKLRELVAEKKSLVTEVDRLNREAKEETEEFNAGFDAHNAGVPIEEEPDQVVHDQWETGWVWAAHLARKRKTDS